MCAEVRARRRLDDVRLVLITNASLLHRWNVLPGLEILDRNNGEIWAKLDAGTEAYYRQVARSAVPFKQILENIRDTARARPIVIQSLFMRINGESPPADGNRGLLSPPARYRRGGWKNQAGADPYHRPTPGRILGCPAGKRRS